MDAADPAPSDRLFQHPCISGREPCPVERLAGRGIVRVISGPPDAPSDALRAKVDRLTALRDRGLLSTAELSVATARLLGI